MDTRPFAQVIEKLTTRINKMGDQDVPGSRPDDLVKLVIALERLHVIQHSYHKRTLAEIEGGEHRT